MERNKHDEALENPQKKKLKPTLNPNFLFNN